MRVKNFWTFLCLCLSSVFSKNGSGSCLAHSPDNSSRLHLQRVQYCRLVRLKPKDKSKQSCHICYLHDRCRRADCWSTWACQKTRPVSSTAPLSRVNLGARVSEGARLDLLFQPPPSSNWKQTTGKSIAFVILSFVCRPAITRGYKHIFMSVFR